MAKSKRKLRAKNSTSIVKLLSNNEVKQYEAGGYVLKEFEEGGDNGDDGKKSKRAAYVKRVTGLLERDGVIPLDLVYGNKELGIPKMGTLEGLSGIPELQDYFFDPYGDMMDTYIEQRGDPKEQEAATKRKRANYLNNVQRTEEEDEAYEEKISVEEEIAANKAYEEECKDPASDCFKRAAQRRYQASRDYDDSGQFVRDVGSLIADGYAELTYKPVVRTAKKAWNDPIGLVSDLGTTAGDLMASPITASKELYDYTLGDGNFEWDNVIDFEAAGTTLDLVSSLPVGNLIGKGVKEGVKVGTKIARPLVKKAITKVDDIYRTPVGAQQFNSGFYGDIKSGIGEITNTIGSKVDEIVWPKKAYRVKTASGKKNLDYSAGQKVSAKEQELLAKVEKKGEWFTDDIDEVAQYAKGNESRAGIFQGDDMVIDEVKIPFWNKNKNVTTNKDVVALKKEQGFIVDGSAGSIYDQRINPNEYIIPRKSIFYPRKSTTIKAMPDEIANKPAMYTLGDGKTQVNVSNTFRRNHPIMDPPKGNETYLTKPYQYLDEQIEGATGINPKIFEGTDDIANAVNKTKKTISRPTAAVTTQETALTKIQQLKKDGLISPTLNEQALIDNPNLLDAAVRDGIKKKLTVNRNVYTGDDFASSVFPEASTEALYTGSHTDIMGNAGTGQRVGLKNMSSGDDALYTFRGKGKINSDYGTHNVEARIPFDYSGSTDEMVTSFNNLQKNRVLAKPNKVVDIPANQIKPGAVIDDVSGEGITAIVGKSGDKVLDPVKVTTDVKLTELNKNYKVLDQEADAFIKTQDVSAVNKKYNTNFKNTEEAQQFLNRRTYNASKELIKYTANPPKNPVLKTTSYSPFLGFEKGGVVRDLSKTQAERYKSNGYILEEY